MMKKSILLLLTLLSCTNSSKNDSLEFITWDNICFDRAMSIWLIRNFVDSTAKFEIIPFGQRIQSGTPFDVPGAELGRQRNYSCFESIIVKYKINDPRLISISKIVHDVDVNTWGPKQTPEADSLDQLFKGIYKKLADKKTIIDTVSVIASHLYHTK